MSDETMSQAEWIRSALERYEGALIRYAMGVTGNLEQARDVVQDTFLKLCTADRQKIGNHLAQWLYTVCRNRALDVRKKEGRMNPLTDVQAKTVASRDPAPSAVAEVNETHRLVLDVLETLPARQRELFRLKIQDGMTYRQISELTGTSVATVCSVVHRAINTIRHRLRDQLDLARDEI